jgi:hypothetical protein
VRPRLFVVAERCASVVVLSLGATASVHAQSSRTSQSVPTSPIELTVQPQRVMPGTPVIIRGSFAWAQKDKLQLTIKTPHAGNIVLTVTPDSTGEFSALFAQTSTAGEYTVTATSTGDAKSEVTALFSVGATGVVKEAIRHELALIATNEALVKKARADMTIAAPASQNEITAGLNQIGAALSVLEIAWTPSPSAAPHPTLADVYIALGESFDLVPQAPPPVKVFFSKLTDWNNQVDDAIQFVQKKNSNTLALESGAARFQPAAYLGLQPLEASAGPLLDSEQASTGLRECNHLSEMVQTLSDIGFLLNFVEVPILLNNSFAGIGEKGGEWLKEVGVAGAKAGFHTVSPNVSLVADIFSLPLRIAGLGEPFAAIETAVHVGVHLWELTDEKDFEESCGKFTGPFVATMSAKATKEGDSQPWWSFEVTLKGQVTFIYSKENSDQLSGQFEGTATRFSVSENALPVLYPHLMGVGTGRILSWHCVSATFRPGIAGQSATSSAGVPTSDTETSARPSLSFGKYLEESLRYLGFNFAYFNVPFTAQGDHGNFKLSFQASAIDFDPVIVRALVRYLVIPMYEPLPIPQLIIFALPYRNAQFILMRALGARSSDVSNENHFELERSYGIDEEYITGSFQPAPITGTVQEDTDQPGVTVLVQTNASYTLTFAACEPENGETCKRAKDSGGLEQ